MMRLYLCDLMLLLLTTTKMMMAIECVRMRIIQSYLFNLKPAFRFVFIIIVFSSLFSPLESATCDILFLWKNATKFNESETDGRDINCVPIC
jgi:ABC-type Na+ efflux pump permease subunit